MCVFSDESASVSIVIPIKNSTNKFLVTIGNKLTIVTWDGESTKPENIEVIASVDGDPVKGRTQFNDGKVDSTGRLWIGTMGALDAKDGWKPELGSLYSLKKKETLIKHVEKISVSNGLVWNDEKKKMYYVDSPTHRIDEFDFDSEANKISECLLPNGLI